MELLTVVDQETNNAWAKFVMNPAKHGVGRAVWPLSLRSIPGE